MTSHNSALRNFDAVDHTGTWVEADFDAIAPGDIYSHEGDGDAWYLCISRSTERVECLDLVTGDWHRSMWTSPSDDPIYIWDGKELPDGTTIHGSNQ